MSEIRSGYRYNDLFDIENRPGAGVRLWGKAVEDQVARVVAASNHHRQNHAPDWMTIPESDRLPPDPDAERRLHTEVYFLALSIRRVLLFHDAISKQIEDPALTEARDAFVAAAPEAKDFRDFFEHLDEYLLGRGRVQKAGKIHDRVSPVLNLSWEAPNVVIRFGDAALDVTEAGLSAVRLAESTNTIWERHLDAARRRAAPPPADDGIQRMLEVTQSTSTVIGSKDEGYMVTTGVLLDVSVRLARPDEISNWRDCRANSE